MGAVKPPFEKALEDRQNVFELKLISLAQELTRYREHSSQEMATKNKEISALRQKLRELEHNANKKNNTASGSNSSNGSGQSKAHPPLVPNGVIERIDDDRESHKKCREDMHQLQAEFQKVKSDLGELMVVYDDLQVGIALGRRTYSTNDWLSAFPLVINALYTHSHTQRSCTVMIYLWVQLKHSTIYECGYWSSFPWAINALSSQVIGCWWNRHGSKEKNSSVTCLCCSTDPLTSDMVQTFDYPVVCMAPKRKLS